MLKTTNIFERFTIVIKQISNLSLDKINSLNEHGFEIKDQW